MMEDYESKSWDEILSQTCPTADEIKQITPVSGHDIVEDGGEWQRCHSLFSHLYRRVGTRRGPFLRCSRPCKTSGFQPLIQQNKTITLPNEALNLAALSAAE